jgi:mevalonate kinase
MVLLAVVSTGSGGGGSFIFLLSNSWGAAEGCRNCSTVSLEIVTEKVPPHPPTISRD